MAVLDFESALGEVGSFGRFQKLLAVFLWGLVGPFLLFTTISQVIFLVAPNHWCAVPDLQGLNLSATDKRHLTVPIESVEDDTPRYSKCQMYDVNFTDLFMKGELPKNPDPSWKVTKCKYGWEYDYSIVHPTIVSEMNWVCDEQWRYYFVHTMFWIGSVFGVVLCGVICDRYGRVPVIILTHTVAAVAGIVTSFVRDFYSLLVVRFLVGSVTISLGIASVVLVLELVGTKQRLRMSSGFLFTYYLAGVALPFVAYALRDWKIFNILTSAPLLIILLLAKFIPESFRWLANNGQEVKAKQVLEAISKVNKCQKDEDFFLELKFKVDSNSQKCASVTDMLRRPGLRKVLLLTMTIWVFMSLGYNGGTLYAANVSDNPYVMLSINNGIDFLANGLSDRLAGRFGRRLPIVVSCLAATFAYLSTAAIPSFYKIPNLVAILSGRLALSIGYNINYLYAAEVYPTVVRSQALAARQAIGSVGALISPEVVLLAMYGENIPLLVFGTICLGGAIMMCWLPETLNTNLPETLTDGENFATSDTGCSFNAITVPCFRTNNKFDLTTKDPKYPQLEIYVAHM